MPSFDLGINLFLQYSGGGVRVAQQATQTGLSWTLQGLPIVTRTIKNLPDEDPSKGYNNITFDHNNQSDLDAAAINNWDLSPDEYNYSISGYAGKFIYIKNAMGTLEVILHEKSDVKISKTVRGWKILDPQGNIYKLEEEEIASDENGTGISGVTAWYISKINNWSETDTLIFNYSTAGDDAVAGRNITQTQFSDQGCFMGTNESSHLISYTQLLVDSIVGKRYKIDFDRSNRLDIINTKKLDRINLRALNGQLLKYVEMQYSYFGNNKKLRLDKVQEKGGDNSTTGSYDLEYTTTDVIDDDGNGVFRVDHWGFGIGTSPSNLLPSTPMLFDNPQHFGNTKRQPDTRSLDALLQKITYPTGWTEEFEYEMHEYSYLNALTVGTSDMGILKTKTINCSGTCVDEMDTISIVEGFPIIRLSYNSVPCDIECSNEIYIRPVGSEVNAYAKSDVQLGFVATPMLATGDYVVYFSQNLDLSSSSLKIEYYEYDTTDDLVQIAAGGARIKSITTPDGVRSFKYMTGGRSSGVLMDVPHYSYMYTHYYDSPTCMGMQTPACKCPCPGTMYSSSSLTQSIASNHIFYTEVDEIFEDSSKINYQYEFATDIQGFTQSLPFTPNSDRQANRGQIKKKTYSAYEGSVYRKVKEEVTDYTSEVIATTNVYSVYSENVDNCPQPAIARSSDFKTFWKRPIQVSTTTFGTSTNASQAITVDQTFEYDDIIKEHVQPIAQSITNSDNKVHRTEFSYPYTYTTNTNIKSDLLAQNRILPAWQTIKKVDGMLIDGQRSLFGQVQANGNVTANNLYDANLKSVPRDIERYEWDGVAPSGSWKNQYNITQYATHVMKPDKAHKEGWAPNSNHIYTWSTMGQLLSYNFLNYTMSYQYDSDHQLPIRITQIDGTANTFDYDGLLRLNLSEQRDINNAVTSHNTYIYDFTTASNPFVETTEHFTKYGDAMTPLTRKTRAFIDGIGRPIQTLKLQQAPNNTDHIALSTSFDALGRISKVYDPVKVTGNDDYKAIQGSWYFTEHAYEPSPLSRETGIKIPQWYWRHNQFGTNATNEVNGYAANSLNKITNIDEEGDKDIIFTDKMGRTILSRRESEGGNDTNDTYTFYDDKSQVVRIEPPGSADILLCNMLIPIMAMIWSRPRNSPIKN